jgi:hypothetical protein
MGAVILDNLSAPTKDQTTGIKIRLGVKPTFALCLYVWTFLLTGMSCLFKSHIMTGKKRSTELLMFSTQRIAVVTSILNS